MSIIESALLLARSLSLKAVTSSEKLFLVCTGVFPPEVRQTFLSTLHPSGAGANIKGLGSLGQVIHLDRASACVCCGALGFCDVGCQLPDSRNE